MRPVDDFLPAVSSVGPFPAADVEDTYDRVRRAVARWLRADDTAAGLLRLARVPGFLRGLVRPVVERVLRVAADFVDPDRPDPKPEAP